MLVVVVVLVLGVHGCQGPQPAGALSGDGGGDHGVLRRGGRSGPGSGRVWRRLPASARSATGAGASAAARPYGLGGPVGGGVASGRPRSAGAGRGCSRVFVMGPREAGRLPRRGARRGPGRGRQAMVEPLKRPWSPISTASDTAVRADRAKAGQTPGGGGGARRRRGRPAMASSSRSRRAVVCTTVPAGRASSGAPAHWAPCRSRGRGGHAAARRRGSGSTSWRRHRRSRGAAASWGRRWRALNQVAAGTRGASAPGHGPPPGKRVRGPHHGRYRRCAPGGPAGSRTVRSVLTRSPLGRSSLEGAATWQAIPSSARAPGPLETGRTGLTASP